MKLSLNARARITAEVRPGLPVLHCPCPTCATSARTTLKLTTFPSHLSCPLTAVVPFHRQSSLPTPTASHASRLGADPALPCSHYQFC